MKSWRNAFRDGVTTGCAASLLSTVILAIQGRHENGTPYAPTNAISHWIWGEPAARKDSLSAQHTLIGYLIHHAASTLWGTVYERWFGDFGERREVVPALAGGATVAALACFVDYQLAPRGLRPGYEKRLSGLALLGVYASVGIGLASAGFLRRGIGQKPAPDSRRKTSPASHSPP